MYRHTLIFTVVCSFFVPPALAQAKSDGKTPNSTDAATITVTKLEVSDKTLAVRYEIKNGAQNDAWICESIAQGSSCEVYLDDDDKTLVIRKRLDVPSSTTWMEPPLGKYVRLRPGKKRNESLLLAVPVNSLHVYSPRRGELRGVVNATRLSIEIGYYVGNLPEMFLAMWEGPDRSAIGQPRVLNERVGVAVTFTETQESLARRDNEVLIFYQSFKGEQALEAAIDGLIIPYKETITPPRYTSPDLTTFTRVQIQYEPSLIEYLYPYENQRRLLNKQEIEYLQSQKSVVIESAKAISDFANELKETMQTVGGIVCGKSKAHVVGYDDSKRVTSFVAYNDAHVDTEEGKRISYLGDLQSLRKSTPQVQPFELRMQCTANLKNLWYRLRFYDRAGKSQVHSFSHLRIDDPNMPGANTAKGQVYTAFSRSRIDKPYRPDTPKRTGDMELEFEKLKEEFLRKAESFSFTVPKNEGAGDLYTTLDLVYPEPQRWCDALEWAFAGWGKNPWHDKKMKTHVCPAVGEGQSTYAMNPNCRPDSPADMVLLFETKAGWNQHGGPELFTFDNHDLRGGCLLLNDGTVKFIRNKEELQQLRRE